MQAKSRFYGKSLRFFLTFLFILTVCFAAPPVPTGAQGEPMLPTLLFRATPMNSRIQVSGTMSCFPVTLTLDDPSTPQSPDWQDYVPGPMTNPYDPTIYSYVRIAPFTDLSGFNAAVSNGPLSRTITLPHLSIKANSNTNIVTGTAPAGSLLDVYVGIVIRPFGIRHVTADPDGDWSADFNLPGSGTDDQNIVDIYAQNPVDVRIAISDQEYYYLSVFAQSDLSPSIKINLGSSWFEAAGFPAASPISLQIMRGEPPELLYDHTSSYTDLNGFLGLDVGFPLEDGMTIYFTAGGVSRVLPLTLKVWSANPATNEIYGKAAPGEQVVVSMIPVVDPTPKLTVVADAGGYWVADFDNHNPPVSIAPPAGTGNGWVEITNANGDVQMATWSLGMPVPFISVQDSWSTISGVNWPANKAITMSVDNPNLAGSPDFTASDLYCAGENTCEFSVDIPLDVPLEPGTVVWMSNGSFETSFTLSLQDVSYDAAADTVSLYANPGTQVLVSAENEDYAQRQGTVNPDGSFTADFSAPGTGEMEQTTMDIGYGTNVYISAGTLGGNQENYFLPGPLGRIVLLMDSNIVRARDWLIGGTITLTADDPATPQNPDYTGTRATTSDRVDFNLTGYLSLKPGVSLHITDGMMTKDVVVGDIGVEGIDVANDTIWGRAAPGSVNVYVEIECLSDVCPSMNATPDGNGDWFMDFSPAGGDPIEDITPDSTGIAQMADSARNVTRVLWYATPRTDQDMDGILDVEDACPGDATNSCDPDGSTAAVVSAGGGTLNTEDQSVALEVPPEALSEVLVLTITEGGSDLQLVDQGETLPVVNVQIGPDGTQFDVPVPITLQWSDADDDGVVDGVGLAEDDLYVFKNGAVIAGPCSAFPTDCDKNANTFTFSVSSLSQFVLGIKPPVISAPLAPTLVSSEVNVSALFEGIELDGSYQLSWDWGDGTSFIHNPESGTLAQTVHAYELPGVYSIGLTVSRAGFELATATYEFVVVYDPSAGYVTGGGWIWSPAGAYLADPMLEGKATFGFVSRYKKGASIPDGNTEFQFKAGTLNFHSDSYEWLVVNQAASRAQYKGKGTINGTSAPNGSAYKFMIWAADDGPDTFRIKIWWEDAAGEHVIYDNGTEQAIGGGSIVVHK